MPIVPTIQKIVSTQKFLVTLETEVDDDGEVEVFVDDEDTARPWAKTAGGAKKTPQKVRVVALAMDQFVHDWGTGTTRVRVVVKSSDGKTREASRQIGP